MMFADRLPLRSLWLGLAALAGMAALRCETATLTAPAPVICTDPPAAEAPEVTAPTTLDTLRARAEHLYRAGNFAAAARAAAGQGTNVVLDIDMQNLAEQYDRLAANWVVGFDETALATDRFVALREAWKLDTVLGGAFTDELYTALASIAPKAKTAFLDAGDYASAEIAANTITALGPR
jgi:hypothetical protein